MKSLAILILIVAGVGFYSGGAWWWTEVPFLVAFAFAAGHLRRQRPR